MKPLTLQDVAVAAVAAAVVLLNCLAYLLAFILAVAGVKATSAESRPLPAPPAKDEDAKRPCWLSPQGAKIYIEDDNTVQMLKRRVMGVIPMRHDPGEDARFDAQWNDVNREALTAQQRNPQLGRGR